MEVEILLYSPFIYGIAFTLCLKDYLGQQIWLRDGIVDFDYMWVSSSDNLEIY